MKPSKIFLVLVLLLAIAGGVLFLSCPPYCEVNESSLKPVTWGEIPKQDNVVVIVFDTLRADHLKPWGYAHDTAPFVSSLTSNAVLAEKAFGGCSSTAPSMASAFTSLYPSQHGIITGFLAHQQLEKEDETEIHLNKIPAALTTLGEKFKAAGYRTYGVADNLNIGPEMGFTRGFDKFETYRYEGAARVNQTVLSWKDEITSGDGPYLMYVHYMDPHAPYNKQAPWFDSKDKSRSASVRAYDSEISYADQHLRELFEQFGWAQNAFLVFFADHGEEFGEHGGHGHGKTLYRESIHVPLLFYHRSFEPQRITFETHLIDILPTMASLLKLPAENTWGGVDLVSYEPDLNNPRPVISELLRRPEHPKDERRSVIQGGPHLIETRAKEGNKRYELFDLRTDWDEKNNLAEQQAEEVKRMIPLLTPSGEIAHSEAAESIEVDDAQLEHLRSLGYVE